MNLENRLALSYYETVATVNNEHKVYLVQHRESKKIYIKKIMDIYNPQIYEYLHTHPITGVPTLYEVCEEDNQLIVIEELISGASLQEIISDRSLTMNLIIKIMLDLCDILNELHCVNPPIIHRDIKPSNIILSSRGQTVLIDFNAAKYMHSGSNSDTMLLGTQGYAAPEQYGFGASTPQTDIYALGILLKELCSALPISQQDLRSDAFDNIVNRCTQLNPSDRPENVGILRTEFEKLRAENKTPLQTSDTVTNNEVSAKHINFALPGFRAKTPWKMFTASLLYACILGFCLILKIAGVPTYMSVIVRLGLFSTMLSIVFCLFNYRNIHHLMPLCKSTHRAIRYLGIFILNVRLICMVFLAMWAAFAIARSLF